MIAVSDRVKTAMLDELGAGRGLADCIAVVPNGVMIPAVRDPAAREAVRWEMGLAAGEVLVLGVGRLTEQKNFEDLIEALARLEPSLPPWKCVIAGEGPRRSALYQRIAEAGLETRITLAGQVADVGALLAAGDIFCLPSLWEGLPLALLEALAAGLPVVAYGIEGVADVVADGEQGILGTPGSSEELTRGLERLIVDTALRKNLGAAGRELVSRQHSWRGMMDRLEEIYLG